MVHHALEKNTFMGGVLIDQRVEVGGQAVPVGRRGDGQGGELLAIGFHAMSPFSLLLNTVGWAMALKPAPTRLIYRGTGVLDHAAPLGQVSLHKRPQLGGCALERLATHGGQFLFPIIKQLNDQGSIELAGLFDADGRTPTYISRGICSADLAGVDLRFNCQPEIVLINPTDEQLQALEDPVDLIHVARKA